MRIGIDIDSTLHDYWPIFARIAKRRFGMDLAYEDQRDWNVSVLRPEQLQTVVEESHSDENVLTAVPYAGAVETLRSWSDAGHWLHITTHRATGARNATARWLEEQGIPFDDLHCSYDKISRCVELGIDLLVDDSPVNIARAIDAGITPATLLHPWNTDICEEEGVLAAGDWPGLTLLLNERYFASAAASAG